MPRFLRIVLLSALFVSLVFAAVVLNKSIETDKDRVLITVGGTQLLVEAARTPLQIEKGLGERSSLGSDGMLFHMPQTVQPAFWMKGMQFALDFIWINNGKVVDITENVPPPAANTPDAQLPLYQPKEAVSHVLEVPAGFIQQHEIQVGDVVVLLQ